MEDENASKQEVAEDKILNEQEAAEFERFKKHKALMNIYSYIRVYSGGMLIFWASHRLYEFPERFSPTKKGEYIIMVFQVMLMMASLFPRLNISWPKQKQQKGQR